MIKINLLDSVTDRPSGVAAVEEKVASRAVQTILLGLVVFGLLFLVAGYDYINAQSAHAAAQKELENQLRIEKQMIAVNKEQEELQKKTNDIQVRIDAIQKLKASQQGPGAVLHEIKARFDAVPGLYLKSIEQKGSELIIKGESPNEASVTRFAQSMEFSSGLFSDLSIETLRQAAQYESKGSTAAASPEDINLPAVEVVAFTVKCGYNPGKSSQSAQPNQTAQPNAAPNQLAKK